MPWKIIPSLDTAHIKQKLEDEIKISGIPALIVVLDAKTWKFCHGFGKGGSEWCRE
jgi:hypothetical protein